MKKQRLILVTVSCLVLFLIGCFETTTVVKVKKDGSGTVEETTFISKRLQEQLDSFAKSFDQDNKGEAKKDKKKSAVSTVDTAKYQKKAAEMGAGVSLVSAKDVTKKDGAKGTKVVYAFTDVRKLKMSTEPDKIGDSGDKTESEPAAPAKKPDYITFDFTAGNPAHLVINMPEEKPKEKPEAKKEDEKSKPEAAAPESPPTEKDLAMVKEMFADFRFSTFVEVEGEIQKSNAAYVQAAEGSKQKNQVVLFDINLGEIITNPEVQKKLAAVEGMESSQEMAKVFKSIPQVKIETARKIDVDFK